MPAGAELKAALDPKNFPRWAQACPEAFAELQKAILDAGLRMQPLRLNKGRQLAVTAIIGHVAAACWAAGQSSVDEARAHGLDVKDINSSGR